MTQVQHLFADRPDHFVVDVASALRLDVRQRLEIDQDQREIAVGLHHSPDVVHHRTEPGKRARAVEFQLILARRPFGLVGRRLVVQKDPPLRERAHFSTAADPLDYAKQIRPQEYSGFHLIAGDRDRVAHVASDAPASLLPDGIFAISNARASIDWPKIAQLYAALAALSPSPETTRLQKLLGYR